MSIYNNWFLGYWFWPLFLICLVTFGRLFRLNGGLLSEYIANLLFSFCPLMWEEQFLANNFVIVKWIIEPIIQHVLFIICKRFTSRFFLTLFLELQNVWTIWLLAFKFCWILRYIQSIVWSSLGIIATDVYLAIL